jgi:hypothetical protein
VLGVITFFSFVIVCIIIYGFIKCTQWLRGNWKLAKSIVEAKEKRKGF